ncbi:Chorismate--pyruvate lyase [Pseudoalteromonas luteoviolacea B = ATCC 29581]|nr:Chorismate--pyruvate lyase [Pseudoalteromonas luteoviolacea B = ATCC 29581]
MCEEGSLTARLKAHYTSFHVEVLSEKRCMPLPGLNTDLEKTKTPMWCREVLLWCDNQPIVYAQSWIPEHVQEMTKLGNTPLGEVLFQSPIWLRGDLQLAKVNDTIHCLLDKLNLEKEEKYARRSEFSRGEHSILVCEVFLQEPKTWLV